MSPIVCKLCQQKAPLCKSHIIPEFCFKPFYDENHRIIEVSDVQKGKVRRMQKGMWERLLCSKCETRVNVFERHARRVFVDSLPDLITDTKTVREFHNVDYAQFKLFLLSILWRASVASHTFFKHVFLGPHEEVVRRMIWEGDPGLVEDYPIMVFALHLQRERLIDWMVEPTPSRMFGLRCYRFLLAGFVVFTIVSQQPAPDKFLRYVLSPERPVRIYDGELSEFRFLREVWNEAAETTKNVQI